MLKMGACYADKMRVLRNLLRRLGDALCFVVLEQLPFVLYFISIKREQPNKTTALLTSNTINY